MNPEPPDKKIIEDLLESGKFYLASNRNSAALKAFNKVIEKDPNNFEAYYHLGLVYEQKNDFQTAKQMYEKCLKINPNHTLSKKQLHKLIGLK